MTDTCRRRRPALLLAAALLMPLSASTVAASKTGTPPLPARRPAVSEPKAVTDYRTKLAAYRAARAPYERKAAAYWNRVEMKRAIRRRKRAKGQSVALTDYVLKQPPVYTGPRWPAPPPSKRHPRKTVRRAIPVVVDFLRHARKHFKFVPDRPATEMNYKRAYAHRALAAGITKHQAVRIYGFEAGGNGRYDVQAGLEFRSRKARAISTALGYNQLLIANTIGLLAEHGARFVVALEAMKEGATPPRAKRLARKAAILRRMIAFTRSVPNRWSRHVKLARTPKGMATHALNLDIDIGPLLQTRKLLDSLEFAKMKGHDGVLSAAELEMMNLMGDGSGLDIVMLPKDIRGKVPTSNFFQRRGYERNPVVIRNNVAATLLAATARRMEGQAELPGAREMATAFDEAGAKLNTARQ